MFLTYLIIFLLAATPFFEIMAIIPIAIVGGLPAVPVMVFAFLGNYLTISLLILFVDKIRKWRTGKKDGGNRESKRSKRAKTIWNKYGLPGLTLIGPFFVGSHLSVLLALTFGGSKRRTFVWISVSLVFWTLVLGIASVYGVDFFIGDLEDSGFLTDLLEK
ncbi:small multi-drug export protein [Sediminibacillus massiliensis]|uniref:small multi-drug export protein n=1 Tax=Sediminibacillus massiliensis TaxID=1926277 RepID=UPI0009885638|nr:small multi-drug export protein [Sediminibacillus massiliensis]